MGGRKIKEMGSSSKGGINEVSFGYHSKMGVYTISMSDIPESYAMLCSNFTFLQIEVFVSFHHSFIWN